MHETPIASRWNSKPYATNKLLAKDFEGITGLYLDKAVVHKVLVSRCVETEEQLMLMLTPQGAMYAKENEDDEMDYLPVSHFNTPFEFGGEKAGISFHNNILAVPFCGSLNLNQFAIEHFDRQEPDFHLLWYNIPPDED